MDGNLIAGIQDPRGSPSGEALARQMTAERPLGWVDTAELSAQQSFENTSWMKAYKYGELLSKEAYPGEEQNIISQEEFRKSPDYREGFQYVPNMTADYLRTLAYNHDKEQWYEQKLGNGSWTAKIAGGLLGGLPDPVNFIMPEEGMISEAVGAARWASMGKLSRALIKSETGIGLATSYQQPLDAFFCLKDTRRIRH